jgi:hypothetical protein
MSIIWAKFRNQNFRFCIEGEPTILAGWRRIITQIRSYRGGDGREDEVLIPSLVGIKCLRRCSKETRKLSSVVNGRRSSFSASRARGSPLPDPADENSKGERPENDGWKAFEVEKREFMAVRK